MLVTEYDLNKTAKKKTLFKLKNSKDWYSINYPYSPKVEAYLIKTHGDNLLSIFNRDGYWKTEFMKVV